MINRLFYKYPSRKNPLGNRQTFHPLRRT
jgi:hypothetical protein